MNYDSQINAANEAGELARDERWSEQRADSEGLRASLTKGVNNIWDEPKKRPRDDLEGLDTRALAEQMFDEYHVDHEKAEREKVELGEFRDIKQLLQRRFGSGNPNENIREMIAAEEMFRKNPAYARDYLWNHYADGTKAQLIARTEEDNSVKEVMKFFKEHEISGPIEEALVQEIYDMHQAGKKSGNHTRDLTTAYKNVMARRRKVAK